MAINAAEDAEAWSTFDRSIEVRNPMADNSNADGTTPSSPNRVSSGLNKYSCMLCHKRKVKCDRLVPCGYCSRHKDECVYQEPPPPKRRKRANDDNSVLLARLQRYEDHFSRAGQISNDRNSIPTPPQTEPIPPVTTPTPEPVATLSDAPGDAARSTSACEGRFITNQGRSRYLDNNLWMTVDDEIRNPEQFLREDFEYHTMEGFQNGPDAEQMLLGTANLSDPPLTDFYPTQPQSFVLWQVYLENVHPLCKILHAPSFQRKIECARENLQAVPDSEMALHFSVFVFAVASMTNAECEKKLRRPRMGLLKRLQYATRQALVKASFVRSTDIVTLQAFVNFLLCMRHGFDAQTLWVLSGVAFRVAQRVGLHREDISDALTPFQSEMRRRLWRQLMILDHTSSELAGAAPTYTILMGFGERGPPRNLNDSDLDPDMHELPPDREGVTEMIFCRLRDKFSTFFLHLTRPPETIFNATSHPLSSKNFPLAEKVKYIDVLEQELEDGFLKYCDPLIPLHNLTQIAGRAAVCGMRLRAHHPRQYPDNGASRPQTEKDMLFSLSIKIMQYDSLVHSTKSLHRFLWHVRVYFQWHAFIYVLTELRSRKSGHEAERAWEQVEEVFHHHPEMMFHHEYALYVAVRSLTLRAWDSREAELRRLNIPFDTPEMISQLRVKKINGMRTSAAGAYSSDQSSIAVTMSIESENTAKSQPASPYTNTWPTGTAEGAGMTPGDGAVVLNESNDLSPVDWEQWDSLLRTMDIPDVDASLDIFFK